MTTQVRDEIAARGELGPATWAMLTRAAAIEVVKFTGLDELETAEDLAVDFFEERLDTYPTALAATSDDDSAMALTRRWMRNWLIDRVRKLPFGAMRNRIEKRLRRSELFVESEVVRFWRLADGPDEDVSVDSDTLREIASRAVVEVSALPSGGVRLGKSGELEELLRRVLERAGRLHISEIAAICAARFPAAMESGDAILASSDDDWDEVEASKEAADALSGTRVKIAEDRFADEILLQLDDRDRAVLRWGDDPSVLGAQLGIGRSSTYAMISRTRARMVEWCGDAEAALRLMPAVVRLILDEGAAVPSDTSMDRETQ
jgi:hypothetical protein